MYYNYKGMDIEYDFFGWGEWSVQYCGDELIFNTDEEARAFIDSIDEVPA